MAVSLEYVDLDDLQDVMTITEQKKATDDSYASGGTISGDGPQRDDQMIRRFLKRAESMAESYVAARYQIPLDTVPEFFKYVILVITRYLLDERGDGAVSEDNQESYDRAIDWLEQVQDHKIELEGTTEDAEDYFGERLGGTFETGAYNDKSTFGTTDPF